MRHTINVALFAALTACSPYPDGSNFTSNEHDEITDIADSSAYSAIEDADQMREIEGRLEQIEHRLDNAGL